MQQKILIADDNPLTLKFMADLLTARGHTVVAVPDGFAALQALSDFIPDILIVDIVMPKIDGEKLCQIVRAQDALKGCTLVVVSAAVAEIMSNEDTAVDADFFIAKGPFDVLGKNLLQVVSAVAGGTVSYEAERILGLDTVKARRMTKELLLRIRELQSILNALEEGILELYAGKIIYANTTAVSLLNMPEESLYSVHLPDLFEAEDRERLNHFLKLRRPFSHVGRKYPLTVRSGRQVVLRKLPYARHALKEIITIVDHTELLKLELQLQHSQRMEAVGTIASGVAHNFRNVLTGVYVNSQLLQMVCDPSSEEYQYSQRINSSVGKGTRLIEDLLQFSRKPNKRAFQPVELSALVRSTYALLESSLKHQNIFFRAKLPRKLTVYGDALALSQVLMNLCANAADAMPGGGTLKVALYTSNFEAVMQIADNGEGMDADTRAQCFDPFFTTKTTGSGTGLGLSTTYGIVKNHQGRIQVFSRPGKGTVFKVRLPLTH